MEFGIIYLNSEKSVLSQNKIVKIEDAFDVCSSNKKLEDKVKKLQIYTFSKDAGEKYVISVFDVIKIILTNCGNVLVINLGESELILEYNRIREAKPWLQSMKVASICIIVFFGAAFSIMSFHEDVGINSLFERMYGMMSFSKGNNIIEISYSIGLALGIIIFYGKLGICKKSNTISPLEIEMQTYEDTVNDAVILQNSEKNHDYGG